MTSLKKARKLRPDAGHGPGSPADDGIDDHAEEPAQTVPWAGTGSSQTVPASPDEPDAESMFRLGDLESECPEKSRRQEGTRTGLRLPPYDCHWDFNPAPPYFLLACYLIVVIIVLVGLFQISAGGAGPSSAADEYQELVREPSTRQHPVPIADFPSRTRSRPRHDE